MNFTICLDCDKIYFLGIKRSLNLDKSSTSNEFLTPTSSKLIKPSKLINC